MQYFKFKILFKMNIKKNFIISGALLIVWTQAFPQEAKENIHQKVYSNGPKDSLIVAKQFLEVSKEKSDDTGIAKAYKTIMHLSPKELQLPYADSMVQAAVRTGSSYEIGAAYITQGVLYNSKKELGKALDSYLVADLYVRAQGDEALKYKHKYSIAAIKHNLGYYDESISMFKECIGYFEQENDEAYVKSLHFLSLSYQKNGQYSLSKKTVESGIKNSIELKINHMIPYFLHVFAVNKYVDGDYNSALLILQTVLPIFLKNKDIGNGATTNYYIGKSLWKIGRRKDATVYFKAVDSIFSHEKYITPELRNSYEMLVDYYDEVGDSEKVSRFAKRLIVAENIINSEFKYLAANLHKKYEAKEMQEKIKKIEIQNSYIENLWDNLFDKIFIFVVFGIYIFTLNPVKNYFWKIIYQMLIENILLNLKLEQFFPEVKKSNGKDYPSLGTTKDILEKLNVPARQKKLSMQRLSLKDLSIEIGFGEKLVSQVINHEIGMSYPDYSHFVPCKNILKMIRDKQIDQSQLRNKDLVKLSGYINGRAFSDGMKQIFGSRPSEFLPKYIKLISLPESESLTIEELIKKVQDEIFRKVH